MPILVIITDTVIASLKLVKLIKVCGKFSDVPKMLDVSFALFCRFLAFDDSLVGHVQLRDG